MEETNLEYNIDDYNLIAKKICQKGMGGILLFLMESHRPLVNISKQILRAFGPFLNFFIKQKELSIFLSVFDSSENFSNFMNCLSNFLNNKVNVD